MLMDCLGPEILVAFWMKGQVLHRGRVHLKVPSWLSDFGAHLMRKLPAFLSPLKDTSGESPNISLVLGSKDGDTYLLLSSFSRSVLYFHSNLWPECVARGP